MPDLPSSFSVHVAGAESLPTVPVIARRGPRRRPRRFPLAVLGLCALLAASGVLHFAVPAPYRSIVPAPLRPQAAAVVAVSGACELVCAALLLSRRTRGLGALATVALFVAVFPANIQMALDSGFPHPPLELNRALIAWLRLPLQAPLILWALRVRRSRGPIPSQS